MPSLTTKAGRVITLRLPQLGDENILFNYYRTLENEDTYILLNPAIPITFAEETDYLKTCLTKIKANWQIYYLAFCDDKLVGTTQINVGGRRKMHLGNFGISILKDYRHDGLGFQLASLIINEAKSKLNLSLITLEVFANNSTAFKLYQKLGFTEYGRLKNGLNYHGDYIDSIFMSKPLWLPLIENNFKPLIILADRF